VTGQKFEAARVMVVVVDTAGKAHGWDVAPGTASWRWTGVHPSHGSTVHIDIDGPMRRRTRDLEDLEAQAGWELEP
jgi:hypothetical protein